MSPTSSITPPFDKMPAAAAAAANSATGSIPLAPTASAAVVAAGRERKQHLIFLSGAASGLVEGVTIQPLEMLKTRFQINTGERMRIIPAIRDIVREGGVRQLYRGGLPEITGLIPRATAALSTLEYTQRRFKAANGGELSAVAGYLSGMASGITEGVVFSPFQVIKVRLMAREHLGRYANTFDCLQKVVASEGISALAIGLTPTLCRNCIWNGIYYGTMSQIESRLTPLANTSLDTGRTVLLGVAVGMSATCFNAPFDVVKSRMQSQLPGHIKYTGVLQALTSIRREEGPQALYKGFWPKAIRLGIGQTFGLLVFKTLLKVAGVDDAPEGLSEELSGAMS